MDTIANNISTNINNSSKISSNTNIVQQELNLSLKCNDN